MTMHYKTKNLVINYKNKKNLNYVNIDVIKSNNLLLIKLEL